MRHKLSQLSVVSKNKTQMTSPGTGTLNPSPIQQGAQLLKGGFKSIYEDNIKPPGASCLMVG